MSPTAPSRWCPRCQATHASMQPCPKAEARRATLEQARGSACARGYDSKWRIIRAAYLKAHPRCVECREPTTDVDHIDGDSRHNAWRNLRALCHSCHSRRTARDQGFGAAMRRR